MNRLIRWIVNILLIIFWGFAFFVCEGAFGATVAYVGIPSLILVMLLIWYVTDRRYEQTPNE